MQDSKFVPLVKSQIPEGLYQSLALWPVKDGHQTTQTRKGSDAPKEFVREEKLILNNQIQNSTIKGSGN